MYQQQPVTSSLARDSTINYMYAEFLACSEIKPSNPPYGSYSALLTRRYSLVLKPRGAGLLSFG